MNDLYEFTGFGNCRSCGKNLLWFKTSNGKSMPIDDVRSLTDRMLEIGNTLDGAVCREHSHFITCPAADQHRRPR